jgi:glutathione-regulated potassium-efflux system ancillary protein KefG
MSRVLIQFAHPAFDKSRVNREMVHAIQDLCDGKSVTFHDLYDRYPDSVIDVDVEKKLLLAHDVIVFHHPFYWYSTPALLKEWCDLVLEWGFAYGEGGTALEGKTWVHALTTGGPEDAYRSEGYNRFTIRQLLAPFDQTAHLCGMHFLAPFVVHGALRLNQEKQIPQVALEYRRFIETLRDCPVERFGKLPSSWASWEKINPHLSELSKRSERQEGRST